MPTLDVVDMNCQRISEMKLNPEVFAVEEKEQLLREVVVMQMASRR